MNLLFPIMTVALIAIGALCLFTAMNNADRLRLIRKPSLSDGRSSNELAAPKLAWKARD